MMGKWAKILLLATAICGLCTATQANTTAMTTTSANSTQELEPTPVISHIHFAPDAKFGASLKLKHNIIAQQKRIALLLPLKSSAFGSAADAVRAGVQAAYENEKNGIEIEVLETDGTTQDALAGYAAAVANFDIVIGPLSRSEVTAIAQSGIVSKPSIALTQPDLGEAELTIPANMLVMGLSIEDEARQVANWMSTDKVLLKAVVISTNTAWQRRAAKAFMTQWRQLGLTAQLLELPFADGVLTPNTLTQVKKRITAENPLAAFLALEASQASQILPAVNNNISVFGTSQLNPQSYFEWQTAERKEEMNGTYLVDIPWQLQPDHPAVMIYPRLVVSPNKVHSADMERLYALGIDAYRVAAQLAAGYTQFSLDGVTGKLKIQFGTTKALFERTKQEAKYENGLVVPIKNAP